MKEISVFKTRLNYKNRRMWTPETIKHPAKAHLGMIEAIILEYTREGDTILDPMAGIGSTLILAMLHNRNAIGIEYETNFCQISRSNILLNRIPRITPLGHAEIIQGDSRYLSNIFKNTTDTIVMSPPYSETLTKKRKGSTHVDQLKHTRQMVGTKDDNIANLKHGDIDSVIMSPPYGDTLTTKAPFKNWSEEGKRRFYNSYIISGGCMSYEDFMEYQLSRKYTYSKDKLNIGNLKGQTYLQAMQSVYRGCHEVLKSNGIMIIITKNYFRDKELVPLDKETIKLCESMGFKLINRHYRRIKNQSFWRTLYKQKWGLEIIYEDILIFQKVIRC